MAKEMTFGTWWRGLTAGQQQAWAQKIHKGAGGDANALEGFNGVVRDELTVQVTFKDATVVLVDRTGRVIPISGMKGVVDANRDFRLVQPEIDYGAILGRLQRFFAPEMKFVSSSEFETRSKALIAKLAEDKQAKNLLKGVYLPLVFPQITITDYGRTLEEIFLAAVKRSYEEAFPGRPFTNHRKNTLAGHQVKIVDGTRHEKLLAMMADGPVVGLWFANPLQGFSIPACREQIAAFQNGILLSGAIDTATAWVADPKTIARDWNTPGNDCAAVRWRSADYSLFFGAVDGGACFDDRYLDAYDDYSGSVLFVG
ncbi:MAG: hypothetical protein WCV84_01480 [Patescibacteria group bacterium]